MDEKYLTDRFKNIGKWIYETIGIEIIEETIRFETYQNSNGKTTARLILLLENTISGYGFLNHADGWRLKGVQISLG